MAFLHHKGLKTTAKSKAGSLMATVVGFIEILAKCTLKPVQLQFGHGFVPWVPFDYGGVKRDSLPLMVLLNISGLVFFSMHPTGVTVRQQQNMPPLVLGEVPDFVDVYDGVPELNFLEEFQSATCTM